jgi:DNA (cytosine-5)-methyltransferase 1
MNSSLQTYDPPKVAEFFAGIGLMRLGLDSAGWRTVFANDIDENKWQMYRDQFGNTGEFIVGDIHALVPNQIPAVDLATASFPCNDLSLAGARKGLAGSQSSAFWGFIDVLKALGDRKPSLILLENVVGFLTSNEGGDLEDALLSLNALGYAVDVFIIDAARFVPQSRQRLFVVGKRTPVSPLMNDTPRFHESQCRPALLADFIMWHGNIAWDIRSLPPLPERSLLLPDVLEKLSLNSKAWWSRERAEYLLNQMSPRHRLVADKMIQGKEVTQGTVFRRVRNGKSMAELRVDGIAGCLRTPRGGSGRQILFQAGQGRFDVRLLTSRECARLMGAGEYAIKVPLNQALFGFGDAVCVPVIKWIADNYLSPLWVENYAKERPAKKPKYSITYR